MILFYGMEISLVFVFMIFFSVSFHLQRFEENSYVNYIASPLAVLFSFTAVSQVYVSLSVGWLPRKKPYK